MTNSADLGQMDLQKPTDLDLHCLQRQGISRFSRTRVNTGYFLIQVAFKTGLTVWLGVDVEGKYSQLNRQYYLAHTMQKCVFRHKQTEKAQIRLRMHAFCTFLKAIFHLTWPHFPLQLDIVCQFGRSVSIYLVCDSSAITLWSHSRSFRQTCDCTNKGRQ